MARIHTEIADLESILTNFRNDHTEQEIAEMEQDLARLTHIQDLWMEFGDIPMDPETECLEMPFQPKDKTGSIITTFPAGTDREYIWHWFEEHFNLSVAEDLMY